MSSRKEHICLKQKDAFGIWEQFKFTYVTSYFWICKFEIFLSVTLRNANQIRAWETTWSPQAAEALLSCWLVRLSSDPVGFHCAGHRCWSHNHTHRPPSPWPELAHPLSKATVCKSNTGQKGQLEVMVFIASSFPIADTQNIHVLVFNF